MGTRNLTRVILDGKVMVNQYGQWDGYPTHTGVNVCDFVKNTNMSDFCDRLKRNINTSDRRGHYSEELFQTIHKKVWEEELRRKNHSYHHALPSTYMVAKELCENGTITEDEMLFYIERHRDMGCSILNAIMNHDRPFHLMMFNDKYRDTAWIEGVYTINLDKRVIEMDYHGHTKSYSFDEIERMDVRAEMKRFEGQN